MSVHIGVDQQAAGRTPIDDLKIMSRVAKKAKVSVAGGISVKTIVRRDLCHFSKPSSIIF